MAISIVNTAGTTRNSDTSTVTESYTVSSGSNRLLLVTIDCYSPSSHPTGVTYDGDSMTKVWEQNGVPGHSSGWVLVAPTVGTANIVASWGSDVDDITMGIIEFTGVDQTTPTGTAVTESAGVGVSETLSFTSDTDEVVVGSLAYTNNTWTADGGQTVAYSSDIGGVGSSTCYKTGDTSVSLSWSSDSSRWHMSGGVPILPASAAPAGNPYYYYAQQ